MCLAEASWAPSAWRMRVSIRAMLRVTYMSVSTTVESAILFSDFGSYVFPVSTFFLKSFFQDVLTTFYCTMQCDNGQFASAITATNSTN